MAHRKSRPDYDFSASPSELMPSNWWVISKSRPDYAVILVPKNKSGMCSVCDAKGNESDWAAIWVWGAALHREDTLHWMEVVYRSWAENRIANEMCLLWAILYRAYRKIKLFLRFFTSNHTRIGMGKQKSSLHVLLVGKQLQDPWGANSNEKGM